MEMDKRSSLPHQARLQIAHRPSRRPGGSQASKSVSAWDKARRSFKARCADRGKHAHPRCEYGDPSLGRDFVVRSLADYSMIIEAIKSDASTDAARARRRQSCGTAAIVLAPWRRAPHTFPRRAAAPPRRRCCPLRQSPSNRCLAVPRGESRGVRGDSIKPHRKPRPRPAVRNAVTGTRTLERARG